MMCCVVKYEFIVAWTDRPHFERDRIVANAEYAADYAAWWCDCCPCPNESVLLVGLRYADFD